MFDRSGYRVFISYSREDLRQVQSIVDVLKKNGLHPMWDDNIRPGAGFHDQIKNFIAHAHVFMPFITEASAKRSWVHQEIGYAMALNIPVLPVCLGRKPGEMIRDLQAIVCEEGLDNLETELSIQKVEDLVNTGHKTTAPLYECAEYHEDRTLMMAKYAKRVLDMGEYGHVRQKGALSSFHIPDKPLTNPVWQRRYGKYSVSQFRCRLLSEERTVLEKHAKKMGCRLIIDPSLTYETYGPEARAVRLKTLLDFLKDMPDDKVRVVTDEGMHMEKNVTIVGDWFFAESVSAALGQGYKHTIFTRHAPSIRSRIEAFDQEFEDLFNRQCSEVKGKSSKKIVTDRIEVILADIIKK